MNFDPLPFLIVALSLTIACQFSNTILSLATASFQIDDILLASGS